MLIRMFIPKAINNEKKDLTHHEIIDCVAEQTAPVSKESKLWIHPNLQQLNISFTYSSKFTYI